MVDPSDPAAEDAPAPSVPLVGTPPAEGAWLDFLGRTLAPPRPGTPA